MVAFDRRLLDRPVHSFDLAVGPGVIDFRQSMFDLVFITAPVKDIPGGQFLSGLIAELDTIVCQSHVDLIRKILNQVFKKISGSSLCLLFMQLNINQF